MENLFQDIFNLFSLISGKCHMDKVKLANVTFLQHTDCKKCTFMLLQTANNHCL